MTTYTNTKWWIRTTIETIAEPNGTNTYRVRVYRLKPTLYAVGHSDFGNLGEAEHHAEIVSGKSAPDMEEAR